MTLPIAAQLYSVRDALAADFVGTIRRIADMGFVGVEFAGIYGESPASAAALVQELGMQVASAHMMPPYSEETFANVAPLQLKTFVVPWLPPERFASAESIAQVCAEVNAADAMARAHGIRLAYHNHDFEYRALPDGSSPLLDHMLPNLAPTVHFELDIYWVKHAGADPAQALRTLGDRASLIHAKDGTGRAGDPFLALGEGIVDVPAALAAAKGAEWLICELDSCATDMFEALEKSARYLVQSGYGHLRS
jgi:sugar phosphate isomerase/epimerase